jgi:hypothetical protein
MNTFFPEAPKIPLPVDYTKISPAYRRIVRHEYIRIQEGKCQYCGLKLSGGPSNKVREAEINVELFPPFFFVNPIHLHHDHKTGMTIGAVHARCNAYLWQYHGE